MNSNWLNRIGELEAKLQQNEQALKRAQEDYKRKYGVYLLVSLTFFAMYQKDAHQLESEMYIFNCKLLYFCGTMDYWKFNMNTKSVWVKVDRISVVL